MLTDTRIKTHAANDSLCVKPLHLGIGVKFVEIAYSQRQICIGKKLNSFSFCQPHEKGVNILLDCSLL